MYINQTRELGLPQYEGSDKLQRADMNAAYQAIDAAIAARPAADSGGRYPSARLALEAETAKNAAALGGTKAAAVLNGLSAEWYVSLQGDDANGDGSAAKPWRTIQYAVNQVKTYHNYIRIHVAAGEYAENINVSYKLAAVYLIGPESGTARIRSITIFNCTNNITIQNMDIYASTDTPVFCVSSSNVPNLTLRNVTVEGNHKGFDGILLNHTFAYLNGVQVSNCKDAVSAVYGSFCNVSYLSVNGVSTSGNDCVYDCYGSVIVSGVTPASDMGATLYKQRAGGIIFVGSSPVGDILENLPLAAGLTYAPNTSNKVYKVCNLVYVDLTIQSTEKFPQYTGMFHLPAGYRPTHLIRNTCYLMSTPSMVSVSSSGAVTSSIDISPNTVFYIQMLYSVI